MAELTAFNGSLNREVPHFRGGRGVGLSDHSFDGDTFETQRRAGTGRTIELGSPICVRIVAP